MKTNTIKVRKLELGQLKANCYLAIDNETKDTLIIDPGDDSNYIQQILTDEEAKPAQIVLTHGHFDHVLAATDLILNLNIPLSIHEEDVFLLKNASNSSMYYSDNSNKVPYPKPTSLLKDKDIIKFGKSSLEVMHTPGHTPGSICLYSKKDNIVFVGDLVFEGGYLGRTDFSYGNNKALEESLQKVLKLPKQTKVLSGHGIDTSIQELKNYF